MKQPLSLVDEVVARLGGPLPVEVWVVTQEEPYESAELVGVTDTLEKAKAMAEKKERRAITWREMETNTDSAGRVYRWVQSDDGTSFFLNLEEVQ